MAAKIIAFEGPDRVGKFTQATLLVERLRSAGKSVSFHEVPAKGDFTYPVIYWMLRNGLAKRLPRLFQRLQIQNRRNLQKKFLSTLAQHDYVILDRWILSAHVYGRASGVELDLNDPSLRLMPPDITIILNGKLGGLEARDVYEKDDMLQARVVRHYRDWAKSNTDAVLIEASLPREEVHRQIWNYLVALGFVSRTEKRNEL